MTERDDDLRKSNPYRVPDGYFSDLRNVMRERISNQQAVNAEQVVVVGGDGWWASIKSMVGFAAVFGCLVMFSAVGYYFTGHKAQVSEHYLVQEDTEDALLGYDIYYEDVEALIAYNTTADEYSEQEDAISSEDIADYLDVYGYGSVDVMTAIDSNLEAN